MSELETAGLEIPTAREGVVLRRVDLAADIGWYLTVRPEPEPFSPDDPAATDHVHFTELRAQRRHEPSDWVNTAIWQDETMVGYIGLYTELWRDTSQVGYRVAQRYQRQGYGSLALRAICDYGFQELDLDKIRARINKYNAPSQGLARKIGFKEVHRQGSDLIFERVSPALLAALPESAMRLSQ